MLIRALGLLLCAVVLGACGAAQSSSVDDKFSGQQREVALLVADLTKAAGDADGAQICSAVLATPFADRLKDGTRTCTQELDDALADADQFDLETQEVAVTGSRAAVRVRDGDGRSRVLDVVREGSDWRIAAIRPSG